MGHTWQAGDLVQVRRRDPHDPVVRTLELGEAAVGEHRDALVDRQGAGPHRGEDDADTARLLAVVLSEHGIEVRIAANGGTDVRRVTLRRVGGRFSRRPDFYRRGSCALLTSYKLIRPVFGGPTKRPLGISYRVSAAASVSVTVTRGSRTIRRFATTSAQAKRTYRLTQGAKGLGTGDYKVTLRATRAGKTTKAVLTSRKL